MRRRSVCLGIVAPLLASLLLTGIAALLAWTWPITAEAHAAIRDRLAG